MVKVSLLLVISVEILENGIRMKNEKKTIRLGATLGASLSGCV
jgi:hypothetical protein